MTRYMQRGLLAAAVGVCLLCFTLPGFADSLARIVRLSEVEGNVQVDRHTGQGFERAILNMPMAQAMSVRTGADGRAEVEFEDGTVVRLVPDGQIEFPQLSLRSSGAKITTIQLDQGTAYLAVKHQGKDEVTISVAQREIPITHSGRFRIQVDGDQVKLAVLSGELEVKQGNERVEVKKGQTITLTPSSGEILAKNIEPGAYDAWDKSRADYHDRYYTSGSYGSYPYYGRGDLSYYGAWYNVPGYGSLWQPYNVSLGWSPFGTGYWCWYPGFGYTWVSGYPWGWLPYRYGAWMWVPGWGWGWTPGSYWGNWRPVPTVGSAPTGYIRPAPPRQPNRPVTPVGAGPNRPHYPYPDLLHNPRVSPESDTAMRTRSFAHTTRPPAVSRTPVMGMAGNADRGINVGRGSTVGQTGTASGPRTTVPSSAAGSGSAGHSSGTWGGGRMSSGGAGGAAGASGGHAGAAPSSGASHAGGTGRVRE